MRNKLIPKFQTPWGPIMQSDNTRVAPIVTQPVVPNFTRLNKSKLGKAVLHKVKKENPDFYNKKVRLEAHKAKPNSEIVRYEDAKGKTRTSSKVIGMSGSDPIASLYVEGVALNPVFKGVGKIAQYGLNKSGFIRYNNIRKINKALNTGINENGILDLYKKNPQMYDIGDVGQYQDYLTTIFPNSKYQGIAYHGGPRGIIKFRTPQSKTLNKNINTGTREYGIYFTPDKNLGEYYARQTKNSDLYTVKLNLPNLMRYDNPSIVQKFGSYKGWGDASRWRFSPDAVHKKWYDRLNLQNYNGIIQHESGSNFSKNQITVFNPEDIHILGSAEDLNKFRQWKLNPIKNKYSVYSPKNIKNTPVADDSNILDHIKWGISNGPVWFGYSSPLIGAGVAIGIIRKGNDKKERYKRIKAHKEYLKSLKDTADNQIIKKGSD